MSNEITLYQSAPAPVVPYQDMERMAAVIAQSGLFGVKSPVQALALMLVAQAEGQHPATAARDYHVIQGRPALKTDAMLARFLAAGGRVQWHEYTDDLVSATFSHSTGGSVRVDWSIDRAKKAGLTGKDTWRQYPRPMLRARVISEGIRTVYPGVLGGMYTLEEVRDMSPIEERDITPAVTVPRFDPDDADAKISQFSDVTAMRTWLAGQRQTHGWRAGDAPYEMLKAACAEQAKVISKPAQPPLNPAPGVAATPKSLSGGEEVTE